MATRFKRVKPRLCCGGKYRAITALQSGNETQAHWGAASRTAHHMYHLLCMSQEASFILLLG
jgi:hypothetical protein